MPSYFLVGLRDGTTIITQERPVHGGRIEWSRCSREYESEAALRIGEGLQDGCSRCGQMYETTYSADVKRVMLEKNLCFDCWFWAEHIKPGGIVIAGHHYELGPEQPKQLPRMRGMGGRLFRIRMLADGRIVETTNLWSQGEVPAHFRQRYPDNAEFLDGAGAQRERGITYFRNSGRLRHDS